jgi:uncharacterized membrane protein
VTAIVDFFVNAAVFCAFGVNWLAVVLVSMVPLVELKGGVPIGVKLGLGYWPSFFFAFLGSSIVCVPLFFIGRWLLRVFKRADEEIRKKAAHLIKTTNEKSKTPKTEKQITFRKFLGVFLFAAFPVPLTGVWTSTLVAVVIRMRFGWTVLAVILGNAVGGLLILGLTWLLGDFIDIFLFALLGIAVVIAVYYLWKLLKPAQTVKGESK